MEEMIAAEEYSNVHYCIDANIDSYEESITNVLFGCIPILLLFFPSLYPKNTSNINPSSPHNPGKNKLKHHTTIALIFNTGMVEFDPKHCENYVYLAK